MLSAQSLRCLTLHYSTVPCGQCEKTNSMGAGHFQAQCSGWAGRPTVRLAITVRGVTGVIHHLEAARLLTPAACSHTYGNVQYPSRSSGLVPGLALPCHAVFLPCDPCCVRVPCQAFLGGVASGEAVPDYSTFKVLYCTVWRVGGRGSCDESKTINERMRASSGLTECFYASVGHGILVSPSLSGSQRYIASLLKKMAVRARISVHDAHGQYSMR